MPAALVTTALLPVVAREFFARETGREYGIGLSAKLKFLVLTIRNNIRVESASNFLYHLIMAGKILQIPKDLPGDLVECGCFKGGSAVNLSRLAAWTGRRLYLFDSFEGLPEPQPGDEEHLVLSELQFHTYEGGAYAGTLDEVRENIRKYGVLDVCEFHKGYFNETLPKFDAQLVFAYVDADLTSSVRDCLRYLWPLLADGSYLFTDEAHHTEIAGLFYDPGWWASELHSTPPGLVGGGNGLGLLLHPGGFRSSLGFTAKLKTQGLKRRVG
ncbi:MAG: TylF/MycF/NovP-related O-methyltransferase [Trebonia sp.]